jgi:Immunity protein 26
LGWQSLINAEVKKMGVKVKVGDVFLVPLDKLSSAGGIVISNRKGELYVAVFQERFDANESDTKKIVNGTPLFLTLTLDAKLWHGHWPIIGNELKNTAKFPRPAFKIQFNEKGYIESLDMGIQRLASENELSILRFRKVSSPAILDDAVKGKFGIVEWNPHYDSLLADYAIKSSKLLS